MIIDKFSFPIYGIVITISLFIGYLYIGLSLKKEKIPTNFILLYTILGLAFCIVFAKILAFITNPNQGFIFSGLSSYGAAIGVVLSSIIFEKIVPTNRHQIKYSILSLPLIYGLSKIGCFLAGCCYGIPYNGPFSVTYPSGLNISLFPIQLVETISFLCLFFIINHFKNKANISKITMLIGVFFKFILDFLRYDHVTNIITFNQIISIILVIVIILYWILNKKIKD